MKKIISSSNLMLRFYVADGWTKEELDKCCKKGEVHIAHPNDELPYFTLTKGSYFHCKKLLERCSSVFKSFNDNPNETTLQFLERMNG